MDKFTCEIQDRDVEILKFGIEMKFFDFDSISALFFKSNDSARKRIRSLEKSNYIKSIRPFPGELKKVYIVTNKGSKDLYKKTNQKSYLIMSSPKFSKSFFAHDFFVIKSRILLEKQKKSVQWRSERRLILDTFYQRLDISRDFLPDAIFQTQNNKLCAFEFENTQKSEKALMDKFLRIKTIIESENPPFEICVVVTSTDKLKMKIKSITEEISNRIFVFSYLDIKDGNYEQ